MITAAQRTAHGSFLATIDGIELTVPDDMSNRHRQMLAEWEAAGNVIPPYEPAYPLTAARTDLVTLLAGATASILAAYPEGERLSWDAKETEAADFMAAEDHALRDYPLLRGEVAAESAIATDAVTLEQLAAKAETVLWMAAQWRALVSRLAGLRKRYMAELDAATTSDARRAVIEAARAEVAG